MVLTIKTYQVSQKQLMNYSIVKLDKTGLLKKNKKKLKNVC